MIMNDTVSMKQGRIASSLLPPLFVQTCIMYTLILQKESSPRIHPSALTSDKGYERPWKKVQWDVENVD